MKEKVALSNVTDTLQCKEITQDSHSTGLLIKIYKNESIVVYLTIISYS